MATSRNTVSAEHEEIAHRAHEIWLNQGRPSGRDMEIWLEAERAVQRKSSEFERNGSVAREAHAHPPGHATPGLTAEGHFAVVLDRGHLRIYSTEKPVGVREPRYVVADSVDFTDGVNSYSSNDTDQAGRFPGSRGTRGGMSIDERLPMKNERDSKLADRIAERVSRFLESRPGATWDYAAGPALHQLVLDRIKPPVRQRLKQALTKDLANIPAAQLRSHFN